MNFEGMIMGVSGARGVVGESLTPEAACRLAAAFGEGRDGPVLVAQDSRPSGVALVQAVAAGLASVGCAAVCAGICTTPGAQVAVEHLGLAGGIMVTASHNPAVWNGLKFIENDGAFLTAEAAAVVYDRARGARQGRRGWDGWPAPQIAPDVGLIHVRRIVGCPLVDAAAVRRRRFCVVVDCNHGASGPLVRALGSILDVELVVLGEAPTGHFVHAPEPVPAHLDELACRVRAAGADMGVAIDPDGDRLVFCAPEGLLPEEATLALAAAAVLRRGDPPVVTNLSTSRMVDDVAGGLGVTVVRTPVGEAHVVAAMKQHHAVLGGEGNGGVIIPAVHHGRDAAAALAVVLGHVASCGTSIQQLWEGIPRYAMLKQKVQIGAGVWERVTETIPALFSPCTLDTRDGVKLIWEDSWLHVRRSNTEPIVRIIAEGADPDGVREMIERVRAHIEGGG